MKSIDPIKRVTKSNETAGYTTYGEVSRGCLYQGVGKKEGGRLKSWRLRWFVLTHRYLLYYIPSNYGEPDKYAFPLGVIPLDSIKKYDDIKELPKNHKIVKQYKTSNYPYCIEIFLKGQRYFRVRVHSQMECVTWVKQLKNNVIKNHEAPVDEEKNIRTDNFLSQKYVWFENFDEYIASLPTPTKVVERKLLQRYHSSIYRNNLHQQLEVESLELQKIIEGISENLVIYDLHRQLLAARKRAGSELDLLNSLLPQLKLPHEIIGYGTRNSESIDIGLAKPIEGAPSVELKITK